MITRGIKINRTKKTIEITKTFDKASSIYGTDEYNELQNARRDNPDYKVVIAKSTKKAAINKGLTYEYMEKYIVAHDDKENSKMGEYNELRANTDEAKELLIESASYTEVVEWFLATFPEIAAYHKKREALIAKIEERKKNAKNPSANEGKSA